VQTLLLLSRQGHAVTSTLINCDNRHAQYAQPTDIYG
jgi:hypothetical protein